MRVHQLLDARGRAVEGIGHPRDLVTALDLDARRQIAGAERLDAGLQALEPARQPAHHRIGADRDRERNAAQHEQKPDERRAVARRRAHDEPAAVRQMHGPGRPLRSVNPSAGVAQRPRQRRSGGGDKLARRIEQCDVGLAAALAMRSTAACCAARGASAAGSRTRDQLARHLEGLRGRRVLGAEPPDRAGDDHHQHQARDDRQIDLLVEPAHGHVSPAPWRRHSRRRAR